LREIEASVGSSTASSHEAFVELVVMLAMTFAALTARTFTALATLTGFTPLTFLALLPFLRLAALFAVVDPNDIIRRGYNGVLDLQSRTWHAG
jgi:hypothetical protein